MALSDMSVAALDILAPLLQRIEVAGDSLHTELSAEALSGVASAIICAGGTCALPRGAAGTLVRLLSCEGVLAQLPSEQVLLAVQHGLAEGQGRGVDLPDALARALVDKLAEHKDAGASPVRAACLMHRCGASPSVVRWAARSMLQAMAAGGAPRRRTPAELLGDLECLAACAITEPVGSDEGAACTAAAEAPGKQQEQGADTPLADYVVEVLRGLAEAAQQGGMQLERDGDGVLLVLRTVAVLWQQLEGLQARRPELLENLHAMMDRVQLRGTDNQSHDPASADSNEDSGSDAISRVFSILELAFTFGKATVRHAWHLVMHQRRPKSACYVRDLHCAVVTGLGRAAATK